MDANLPRRHIFISLTLSSTRRKTALVNEAILFFSYDQTDNVQSEMKRMIPRYKVGSSVNFCCWAWARACMDCLRPKLLQHRFYYFGY